MKFILQTIGDKVTLDMCFQMERALEYWNRRDYHNSFAIMYSTLSGVGRIDGYWHDCVQPNMPFVPEDWCPVGTIEFVEKYLRTYFGDKITDNAMHPLNVTGCFLYNKMDTGREIHDTFLEYGIIKTRTGEPDETKYFIKDNERIKNQNNGIMTLGEAYEKGLRHVECSQLIKEGHNSSEWRAFIHNGKVVDIKNYAGNPFVFPNMDTVINSYMYRLEDTLKEGTLDVYVDELDDETYVMECHKFFSCGLYGFNQLDILPLMYWRTYKDLIKKD